MKIIKLEFDDDEDTQNTIQSLLESIIENVRDLQRNYGIGGALLANLALLYKLIVQYRK